MTADRSAAADTLRDELAAVFRLPPGEERMGDRTPGDIADALLPVVRRFADAQVAAERERIATNLLMAPSYDANTRRYFADLARGQS